MKDILLTDGYDLQVSAGDFTVGNSDLQHQELLLLSHPGEWKGYPRAGVGISDYLLDDGSADMLRAIRTEFNRDGMTVNSLTIGSDGKLLISAGYGK